MSELNLEQQVERIKLAMDTCLDIYQTNDKTTFINKLKILKELDIIKELNTWLAKCDSQKRNYPRIKETVAYEVFSTLFKPKKKEETGFLWTNVQLGLSIMDIYNQKIRGVMTSFFDKHKVLDLFEINSKKTIQKETPLDMIFYLQNKGNKELNNPLSPNYLNAKKYFEKALDVLNKNENITYRPELIEGLTDSISKTESRYEEWLQNYHEMKKYLNKRFDINKQLTHQHCEKIYKGLKDLEFGIYTQKYTDLKERFSGANLFAIHAYCLKFIKILERKKYSKFNSIISKLYVRSSTFNRKKVYYLKKALKTDKNNLEGYYQLARHYESIGEEKKALENWIKFSEVYFTKTKNKRFKKSKKGLLKILGHPYIFDPILVKRSERDLFKEFIITKIVYENLQRRELTSKPLYYLKTKEGYDYVVFRESQTKIGKADESRNLSAIINYLYNLKTNTKLFSQIKWANKKDIITNFEIGCLKKVINNLTNITRTTYLDNIVLDYDYGLKLRKKLNKTFLTNAEEFYKKCSFILDYLKQQPRSLCHADLHLDNILQMGGEFCVLDYGNATRASNVLDIAYLLEQEGLHLDSEQKKGLYHYFLNKSKIKIADKDETYDYHALYVNLLGVSTFNDERQKKYLHRADEIITKMCAYSKNKELLCDLKEELKFFLNIVKDP